MGAWFQPHCHKQRKPRVDVNLRRGGGRTAALAALIIFFCINRLNDHNQRSAFCFPNSSSFQNSMATALFDGTWGNADNLGFGLVDADVKNFVASDSLVGIPITVNHNGLEQAIRHLDSTQTTVTKKSFRDALATTATGTAQIVGRVVSAGPGTKVLFSLKENFGGLQEMVRTGIFTGRCAF